MSNDNPYSEANSKTPRHTTRRSTTYCPSFPGRFGSIHDTRKFCTTFFEHYDHLHHCGIGLYTAASVHCGTADQIRALRQQTLDAAYAANPDRFSGRTPTASKLPTVAWINQLLNDTSPPRSAHTERLIPTCLSRIDKFRRVPTGRAPRHRRSAAASTVRSRRRRSSSRRGHRQAAGRRST